MMNFTMTETNEVSTEILMLQLSQKSLQHESSRAESTTLSRTFGEHQGSNRAPSRLEQVSTSSLQPAGRLGRSARRYMLVVRLLGRPQPPNPFRPRKPIQQSSNVSQPFVKLLLLGVDQEYYEEQI